LTNAYQLTMSSCKRSNWSCGSRYTTAVSTSCCGWQL